MYAQSKGVDFLLQGHRVRRGQGALLDNSMASSTPPTVAPMEIDPAHPETLSNPVTGAAGGFATVDALVPPIVEQRVEMLLTELEELVPQLPVATVAVVLIRLRAMAAARGSPESSGADSASPMRPEQLSYANQDGVLMLSGRQDDEARSEAGSLGSAAEVAAVPGDHSPLELAEAADSDDPRADSNGWGDLDIVDWGGLDIEVGLWQPSRAAVAGGFDMVMDAAADNAIITYDPTTRERRGRRGRSERDELGLGANGRVMYCDFHDHGCGVVHACMAVDMLQQRSIYELVEKHRKRRREQPRDDPDGRKARHALYKAVIAWQWANPLGAENRVRLPTCVLHRVRRLFPNPCCRVGTCDFLVECERVGHYTGFRTAEESRAIREGRFMCVDCR